MPLPGGGRLCLRTRSWQLVMPVALFALALGVRCLPWEYVFQAGRTAFAGSDAYYHMRRIAWSLAHYPRALGFDPYLNFPDGGRAIWPPLFDQALATLLLPVYAWGGIEAAERGAALVPPLLGAGTVVVVWAVARRLFDPATAAVSGAVLAVISGHAWYSQLGFVDHHAAVALLASIALLLGASLVTRSDARGLAAPLAYGICTAAALLCWPGALLYAAIVELAWLVFWGTRPELESARRVATQRAAAYGLAFAGVLPVAVTQTWEHWQAFSPSVLSGFQPWGLALLTLHALGCRACWGLRGLGGGQRGRAVAIAGIAALLLVGSLIVLPGLSGAGAEAWRWLARREAFQSGVFESAPLFSSAGGLSTEVAELRLSRFLYLSPLAWGALVWSSRHEARRRERWLGALWMLVVLAATLAQRRFFNTGSIAVALLLGWSVVRVARALSSRMPTQLARVGVGALAIWLLAPTFAAYTQPLEIPAAEGEGRLTRLGAHFVRQRPLVETAEWIARHTPPTAGYDAGGAVPEYGLLSHWDLGHVLLYVGRRPTVVGNFGDDVGPENFALHHRYLAAPEPEAVRILDDRRARYVVVEVPREAQWRGLPESATLRRLSGPVLRNLRYHRLLYESRSTPQSVYFTRGYRVFERVRGARVEGRCLPGARVEARLSIALPGGRQRPVVSATRAGADGRYRLVIAQPGPGWRLESGPHRALLDIPEPAVSEGTRVPGPALLPERSSGAGEG